MDRVDLDSAWTICAALMVFFMHGGFGFYEAGMCRAKNTVDTLSHNLLILAVTALVYWGVGFGLMFGAGDGFCGWGGFAPSLAGPASAFPALGARDVPLAVSFAFALSFSDTPATLIAGSGAERIRFWAVLGLTVAISGAIFPVVGHWVLGGGWLSKLAVPLYDTGSGCVQLCGGCCALVVSSMLGPRRGLGGVEKHRQVSSMPLVFLGAFILWLGFIAFNAGLAMKISGSVGLVVANTVLAGGAGASAAVLVARLLRGRVELRTAIVGLLTANVAVTSPSAVVEPWAAAALGGAAGVLAAWAIGIWPRLGLDDPTEYITMNVLGGALGMAAVGLLASPAILARYPVARPPLPGTLYGGGAAQFWTQFCGAAAVAGFSLATAALACAPLKRLGWLREPASEEGEGADRSTHGEHAYER